MNSVKNLMIIAVLGAVGYGVYVSLQRNNVDSGPQLSVTDGLASEPKVDTSGTTAPKLGGPLALSGAPSPSGLSASGSPTIAPPLGQSAPTAPPVSSSAAPPLGSGGLSAAGPAATLGPPMPTSGPMPSSPASQATAGVPAPSPISNSPSANGVNILPPPMADAPRNPPPRQTATDREVQNEVNSVMEKVQTTLREGKLVEAHIALSLLYDANLPPEQSKQITAMLDQLAGTVIYSQRHYLEPAYSAQPGETIEKVAQKYNVPWQLLARINGLMPPDAANTQGATKDQPLPAGLELKVVRGPFDATVRLDRKELTLRLPYRQGQQSLSLYAGRFPIGVGRDQPKLDGEYTVRNKAVNPVYYSPDGLAVQPGDPRNPLRDAWIGLTDRIGIHGADPQAVGRDNNPGTICVGQRDLRDLFGILSVGSRVTVLR
ncbi:MAG: LysM peptidoglycan-binding domain-containing protein [Thermoguttaceae bacterium]